MERNIALVTNDVDSPLISIDDVTGQLYANGEPIGATGITGPSSITDNPSYSTAGMVNGIVGAFQYLFDTGQPAPSPVAPSGESQIIG